MQWEVAADPRLRERAPGERDAGGERARGRRGARPRARRPRGTWRGLRDRRRRSRRPRHVPRGDRKSTRLNSSHVSISYAVFRLKKKKYAFFISLVTYGAFPHGQRTYAPKPLPNYIPPHSANASQKSATPQPIIQTEISALPGHS